MNTETRREMYEVWSEPSFRAPSRKSWYVQFPKGRMAFRTKKAAIKVAESLKSA